MRRGAVAALLTLMLMAAAGCSDGDDDAVATTGASPGVTICEPAPQSQPDDELPQVGLVEDAIEAVAAELGAPPQFFEINVTASVVNLFVAVNEGTAVQPWAYANGEIAAQDVRDASGGTFVADDVDFDPEQVLGPVREEIPDAILESFYIHGDGQGNVQYGVLASALCGGGFDITVDPDGEVVSLEAL